MNVINLHIGKLNLYCVAYIQNGRERERKREREREREREGEGEREREREKRVSPLLFERAPPCRAVGRFISQRLRVTGEAGSCQCVSVAGSHWSAIGKDS